MKIIRNDKSNPKRADEIEIGTIFTGIINGDNDVFFRGKYIVIDLDTGYYWTPIEAEEWNLVIFNYKECKATLTID